MAEIIEFPGKMRPLPPTAEELEVIAFEEMEECIDRAVKNFIIDAVKNVTNVSDEFLQTQEMVTQKTIGLMRESMRAVIFKLQDKHHDLQDVAEEIIIFEDDAREQIIEDDE